MFQLFRYYVYFSQKDREVEVHVRVLIIFRVFYFLTFYNVCDIQSRFLLHVLLIQSLQILYTSVYSIDTADTVVVLLVNFFWMLRLFKINYSNV